MRKNLAKSCGCFVIRIGLLGLLKVKGERERILESRARVVLLSMVIMAPRDVRIASLRRVKRQLLQKHTLQTTVLFARSEKGNAIMQFLHAQKWQSYYQSRANFNFEDETLSEAMQHGKFPKMTCMQNWFVQCQMETKISEYDSWGVKRETGSSYIWPQIPQGISGDPGDRGSIIILHGGPGVTLQSYPGWLAILDALIPGSSGICSPNAHPSVQRMEYRCFLKWTGHQFVRSSNSSSNVCFTWKPETAQNLTRITRSSSRASVIATCHGCSFSEGLERLMNDVGFCEGAPP